MIFLFIFKSFRKSQIKLKFLKYDLKNYVLFVTFFFKIFIVYGFEQKTVLKIKWVFSPILVTTAASLFY